MSNDPNQNMSSSSDEDEEYYVIPQPYPIPVDELVHTDEKPFCWNEACDCHEDDEAIAEVNEFYQEGLVSADDATRIVQGKTL